MLLYDNICYLIDFVLLAWLFETRPIVDWSKLVGQWVIKMQSEDQSMELDQTDGLPETSWNIAREPKSNVRSDIYVEYFFSQKKREIEHYIDDTKRIKNFCIYPSHNYLGRM